MPDRPPPPLAPIQRYQIQDWGGWKLYVCNFCIFDTLTLANMRHHEKVGCRPPDGEWERDRAAMELFNENAPQRYDESTKGDD